MALQFDPHTHPLWQDFIKAHNVSVRQQEQFLLYAQSLQETNEKFNVTALTDFSDIITHHFADSISLLKFYDLTHCVGMADVGTGGGFPGLAIKIMCPDVPLYLIEVNKKKCVYLAELAGQLGLEGVHVIDLDWRTFLRNTDFSIDFFMARASLHPDELFRLFKPSCHYNHATLVYWASQHWQPTQDEQKYVTQAYEYMIAGKQRKYIVCKGGQ